MRKTFAAYAVDGVRSLGRGTLRLSMKKLDRGSHITRFSMYGTLKNKLLQEDIEGKLVLSVSHSVELCNMLGLGGARVTEANYPQQSLLNLPYQDDQFDFVISDQVLEHIEGSPQDAITESWRVLKPGGIAVHTTCFINPVHKDPNDFWRFTPDGLNLLCLSFSEILEVGGWGNPYAWCVIWLGLRYDGIPLASWHPMHRIATKNDESWPIVTWIVARK